MNGLGTSAKIGSAWPSGVSPTSMVPISQPRGFLATCPPVAAAASWAAKQMARTGGPSAVDATAASQPPRPRIQRSSSRTEAAEPVTMIPCTPAAPCGGTPSVGTCTTRSRAPLSASAAPSHWS